MKYIIFRTKIGDMTLDFPIIFPNMLVHERVAQAFKVMARKTHQWEIEPVSAGEVSIPLGTDEVHCYGESTTLKLKAREHDAAIIIMSDYGGGFS